MHFRQDTGWGGLPSWITAAAIPIAVSSPLMAAAPWMGSLQEGHSAWSLYPAHSLLQTHIHIGSRAVSGKAPQMKA